MKKDTWLIAFVLMAGIIFLMPNGMEARDQRITGFTLAMLIGAGVYLFSIDKLLGALICYVGLISGITAYRDPLLYYMLFSLIIFLVYIVKSDFNKEKLYDLLIAIACLNVVFQILQTFHINNYLVIARNSTPGLMSHVNETSALYAMVAPAFFRKKRWYFLPVIIAGLIMSRSFQGVVTFSIICSLWFLINTSLKRAITMSVIFALLTICFSLYVKPFEYQNYRTKRINLWHQTVKVTLIKPIFGWGFDQYRFVMPLITSWGYLKPEEKSAIHSYIFDRKSFDKAATKVSGGKIEYFTSNKQLNELHIQAHNEYIEWLFVGGIAGSIIGLSFLGRIIFKAFSHVDKIPFYGLLAASIVCLFGFSWHLMPLILITVLYIALTERTICKKYYQNYALGLQE